MRLYASSRSPFVRKVVIALCELGLADRVQLIPALVRMDAPNEGVLAHNPLGKIPTLVREDGSAISGSLAIIDELDRLAGGGLIPADRAVRSWHLQHEALSDGLLDVLVLWRNEREKPAERQTERWLSNFEVKAARTLDVLETTVEDLAASDFGLAHISLTALVIYLDFRFDSLCWRDGRSRLAAWADAAMARPSAQQAARLCEGL